MTNACASTATSPTATTVASGTSRNEASVRLWGITFDMSGMRRWAKPAGACPLDGGVMPQAGLEAQQPSHRPNRPCVQASELARAPEPAQHALAAGTHRALAAEGRIARTDGGRTTDALCLANWFAKGGLL